MPRPHDDFENLRLFDHPLIQHKLTRMRDRGESHAEFRLLLNQIAGLMTFQVSRNLPVETCEIDTPLERTTGTRIAAPVTLVPILRAGIGMTDGMLALMPEARVGHIGLYRDETTLKPVSYYLKLPEDVGAGPVFLIDPMLATGGSSSHAATELKKAGATDIRMLCLVASPEGVGRMLSDHPDVLVYAAALDRELDSKGYIRPGLGDAGDRIFGTQ